MPVGPTAGTALYTGVTKVTERHRSHGLPSVLYTAPSLQSFERDPSFNSPLSKLQQLRFNQ